MVKRPLKSGDVSSAEAELSLALDDCDAPGVLRHLVLDDGGSAVRRIIIYDKDVKSMLGVELQYSVDDSGGIFALVVHRYDYYTVVSIHGRVISLLS